MAQPLIPSAVDELRDVLLNVGTGHLLRMGAVKMQAAQSSAELAGLT